MNTNNTSLPAPLGLLAELTHRCPLGCPYCSNPLALDPRADELDSATWARVFREAAGLGVLQVHLSGGEPAARRDLADIVQAARDAGLYTNLITSAVSLTPQTLQALADAGLDHVQISIQDSEEKSANHIAGYKGASARKRVLAAEVVRLGLPLTVNMVVHRANIGRIEPMGLPSCLHQRHGRLRPIVGVDAKHMVVRFHALHVREGFDRLEPTRRSLRKADLQNVVPRDGGLELQRRIQGDQLAVVNDGDAVAEFVGFIHVVRGQKDS